MRDFIFIGIIKLSCFYFAIYYLFAKSTPRKSKIVLCLAPYYFRVCLRFKSSFAFEMVVALFLQLLACFPLVTSSTVICSNLHTKLFRGQAREGEGKERDTLSYPGFMLHPRLPNLQQLFLKRNHRISTSRNTSSLSYPDIVLYLIPHFFV